MDLNKYYQKRKKEELARRALFFLYLVFGAVALGWGFFWISYLRISHIQIKDSYYTNGEDAEVKKALDPLLSSKNNWFLPKNNYFIFHEKDAEQILRQENIGIATVSKHFPHSIEIIFQESKPKFIFCRESACFYLDQNGIIVEKAPTFSDNILPTLLLKNMPRSIRIGDQLVPKSDAEFLSGFAEGIKNININADKIEMIPNAENDKEFKISVKEGWMIYVSTAFPPDIVVGNLKLLLEEKIKDKKLSLEYIDLRFPHKAFYKLKSINQN